MTNNPTKVWPRRVAVLGVGLLGGSVCLALRRKRPETVFVGYSRTLAKLKRAKQDGIIDEATDTVADACRGCDVIVIATPVDRIAALVVEAAAASPTGCLITDVGSTKVKIVAEVANHREANQKFVAAHPIAGSEKSGADHALESLFDQKLVLLTPGADTDPAQIRKAETFWELTGSQIRTMDADQHDALLAAASHVPHLVSALVAKISSEESRALVGSGWRDITRVASGDPEMWAAICQENRQAIIGELTRLAGELDHLRAIIVSEDDDQLHAWLRQAKESKEMTTGHR